MPSAKTFVYVSNAEDGDIASFHLTADGALEPRARVAAAKLVMPMAVSPDRRFLYAAARSEPNSLHTYAIDRGTGALAPLAVSPLAESFPYISLDRTGRFLFAASYGSHLVTVNAVDADGRVAPKPSQLIPVGRNAHSIRIEASNRFVFVPCLGSDAIFQFTFDAATGRLASNTPAIFLMKPGTGPRHFITAPDNKFLYVLSEFLGTVTSFALDSKSGLLAEVGSVSGLPPGSKLGPGAPRGSGGAARNTENDVWAADIHMTPDGKLLVMSERTGSTLTSFRVDAATGKLTPIATVPTERQPRGFAIDPSGRFLVASGEKSETLSVHAIDAGALRLLGKYPSGRGANWVEIVGFD